LRVSEARDLGDVDRPGDQYEGLPRCRDAWPREEPARLRLQLHGRDHHVKPQSRWNHLPAETADTRRMVGPEGNCFDWNRGCHTRT
jgi:hypothetical protein